MIPPENILSTTDVHVAIHVKFDPGSGDRGQFLADKSFLCDLPRRVFFWRSTPIESTVLLPSKFQAGYVIAECL